MLVLAQWWWVRRLTSELSSELDAVVTQVGESVVAFFKDPVHPSHGQTAHAPLAQAHEAVVDCSSEDCDGQLSRRLEGLESAEELLSRLDDGTLVEMIRRTDSERRETADEEAETPRAFAYRIETGTDGEPEKVIDRRVQIHIEHRNGDRFLWVGAPQKSRRFQIEGRGLSDRLERFSQRMVVGSVGFLALGLALAGVVAHRVTKPLRQLVGAARQLGEGALGTQVPVQAKGEVGQTIRAFNRMSGQLEELDAKARALDANRHLGEIGEIARGLAHTLRNPLNALGLSVEELAGRNAVGSEVPELAESARRQIRRIDHSIRSFLALASQSGGVLTEVDVGELIEDVGLEALQDGRGKVRLEIDVAAGVPTLRGVEPELRAVLQALVVNAIEASPEGGQVTVRATTPASGRLRVELDDEGPGLPEAVRERLFTPHLSTKTNGSGMGLFLAHRIATNRYSGYLELVDRDRLEGGTRAILELGEREQSSNERETRRR